MDADLTLEVQLTDLICNACRSEFVANLPSDHLPYHIMSVRVPGSEDEEPVTVTLDVKKIRWQTQGGGRYTAYALLLICCPSCESPRELRYNLKAPVVFLNAISVCKTCGDNLALEDEELEYTDTGEVNSLIEIRGNMVCNNCMTKYLKEIQIFSPECLHLVKQGKLEIEIVEEKVRINSRDFHVMWKETEPEMINTNVLVIFANPKGSNTIRLGNEDRVARECIERSKHKDAIALTIKHAARIDDFARALLEQEYRIVQFSGHGTGTGLAFENELGEVQVIPRDALAELLAAYSPPIECVVLNACYSDVHSQHLSMGVPYSIVMSGPISDEGATEFTRGFYDAIGAGKSVEFAYKEGCRRIKLKGLPDGATPVLYTRSPTMI